MITQIMHDVPKTYFRKELKTKTIAGDRGSMDAGGNHWRYCRIAFRIQ